MNAFFPLLYMSGSKTKTLIEGKIVHNAFWFVKNINDDRMSPNSL